MHWYLAVLKKYAVFHGRARRKEYWMFFLLTFIISFALDFIAIKLGSPVWSHHSVPGMIYQFAVLIPSIAVGVRRMHDTGHSGWWLIVPLANLVLAVTEGTRGDNKYGPDPKALEP